MSDTAHDGEVSDGLDLDGLAHLARLKIVDPTVAAATRDQVDRLLGHFAILREVDTDGVAPSAYPIEIQNRMRADEPSDTLSQDQVLKNAPQKRAGCFLVPRVVDG